MSPGALAQVLRPLQFQHHDQLIVGLQTSDDAAVFRLSADLAIVQTIDFFTPIVDDPYTYGAIAAANSMSDIYAMGGDVSFALNVVAFPDNLDPSILAAVIQGGADKVAEAGGVIAGGHTVTDKEPKYGLSVTGLIHPDRIWTKAGAADGDVLFLTKPIGTGILATALKNQVATPDHIDAAVASMSMLNRRASEIARAFPVSACTDITGFGLIGHASEIAAKSSVQILISASQIPLLPGALEYARGGQQPGGLGRNRAFYEANGASINAEVDAPLSALLYDPQTSGGLLFAIPEKFGAAFKAAFTTGEQAIWEIGKVRAGTGLVVIN